MSKAVVHNCELLDFQSNRVAEVRAAVELLPTKHDQMTVGLQNNISEAVLHFDAQLRKEIDVVMNEVDKKLQEQFATTSQIIATMADGVRAPAAAAHPPPDAFGRIMADITAMKAKIAESPDYLGNRKTF